jgi:hypothetical protein
LSHERQRLQLANDSLRHELDKQRLESVAELNAAYSHRNDWTTETLVPIAVCTTLFGSIAFVLWIFFTNRSKERLAAIDRGLDSETSKAIFGTTRDSASSSMTALKWGLFIVGIGVGGSLGFVVHPSWIELSIMFGMISGGGLGLVAFYLIASRKEKNSSIDSRI